MTEKKKVYTVGSKPWKTSLRRSLAQKKRHGAKIYDMEGLIKFIERKATVGKKVSSKISRPRKSPYQK